jgi:hypothetical protein
MLKILKTVRCTRSARSCDVIGRTPQGGSKSDSTESASTRARRTERCSWSEPQCD